jgi:hypothetical protein
VTAPAASQAISRLLAAELGARTAWDEPPCLYAIRQQAGRFRLQPLPIPPAAWATGRPPDVLEAIARTAELAARLPGTRRRSDLYGTAFRFEGWGLDMQNMTSDQRRQGQADAAAHLIHARPDRVEYRLLLAADRTGTTYAAHQQRGQHQPTEDIFPPGRHHHHDGAIPDALRRLTTALTGLPPPQPGPEAEP